MEQKENLDHYDKAYETEFKYNDENAWFLTRYANYMKDAIQANNYKSIVSLGIGHHIVSDILSSELNDGLEKYEILEGSKSLIDKFEISSNHKNRLSLTHTYFEDFDTNEKYDVIEMGFVLEHVDDPALIIQKFKEFLAPNGKMFISVPNARSLHRQIGFEAGLMESMYQLSDYDRQLGHKRYFDLDQLSKMVIDADLQIDNTIGLLLKPITAGQIKQLNWDKNIVDALVKLGDQYPDLSNCFLIEASIK